MPTDREIEEAAKSVAAMVIEWVDKGTELGTDWRPGLVGVIARRMTRLRAAERVRGERESRLVEVLRPFACDCADSEVGCGEYRYAEFSGKSKEACARWNARAVLAEYEKGA